ASGGASMRAGGLARVLWLIALALAFGFVELSLVFSDLAPDETALERAIVTGLFTFFSAALVGYLNPRLWPIGILSAWGGVFLGFPIAIAVVGAFIGANLKSRRIVPRLI